MPAPMLPPVKRTGERRGQSADLELGTSINNSATLIETLNPAERQCHVLTHRSIAASVGLWG